MVQQFLGNLWKPLETFGNLWKPLETFGTFGNIWKPLDIFWKPLETFGKETFGHLDFSRFLDIPRW
jgi:hypothetical protein